MSTTITLRATQDAYTDEGVPNRNFGNQVKLGVNGSGGGQIQRTYVAYSLKSLPKTAIIKSAYLRLYLRGSTWAGANVLTARRITSKWTEKNIKFSNAPSTTATNSVDVTVTAGSADDLVEWDITDMVTDAVSGSAWHGVRITKDSAADDFFHSSEQSNHNLRPKLVVTYALRPAAPSNLRPRGDHAVDAASPKLAWDSETVSAVWVQVDNNSDCASPFYDSGWETATEPYWDLALASTPSFTAMVDGDDVYWRVKVKSEDGDASEYSDIAQFQRQVYGTLDVTSPAVDGDPVDESTPTIITDFTGGTQTLIGWTVFRKSTTDSDYVQVLNQQPIATTDDTFELASGAVTDPAALYKILVRVWDEYDRETAVGETAYVPKIRQFIYDPSAGVNPVAALAASQPTTEAPKIRVSWTRAASPDSYDVWLDGKIIAQNIDPGDVFVSGTSYQYDTYVAAPRVSHTFEVIATENHVNSITNPTVDITPSVSAIWIMCPDENLMVPLWDKESSSVVLGESGTTYELLNRPTPVRIIDAIRGLEGNVAGLLSDGYDGLNVEDAFADLMTIKGLPLNVEMRLCFGPKNIPVLLGGLSITPLPDPEERWDVSIDFWQTGEFDIE